MFKVYCQLPSPTVIFMPQAAAPVAATHSDMSAKAALRRLLENRQEQASFFFSFFKFNLSPPPLPGLLGHRQIVLEYPP
jgi:hypothetical protein